MDRTMRTLVFIFTATFLIVIILASSAFAVCNPGVKSGESIQAAIDAITSTPAEICIGVGTYEEDIVLKSGITLQGEELARTIIDASGSGAIVTAASNTTILNLTLRNGSSGILLNSTSSLDSISGVVVKNVIITETATAIDCTDCEITIDHAVIDKNTTGIEMASQISTLPQFSVTFQNSMLVGNTTDVRSDQTPITFTEASHNLLFDNTNDNYPADETTSIRGTNADPLFVANASNDYHVKINSPAIDAGTGENDLDGTAADIGAYGGPDMDTTPFPVGNIMASRVDDTTLDVSWNKNEAYNITRYNVYYDFDKAGEPYANSVVVGNVDTTQLANLEGNPTDVAPKIQSTAPGDGKLFVTWNAVTGAKGYRLYYGLAYNDYPHSIDVGNNTSAEITGLTNGTTYWLAVSALFETVYYVSVAAVDSVNRESKLVNETSEVLQPETEGPQSTEEVSDFPEESVPYPPLKDEDRCFIATAAFGAPWEPHVKLLRNFRDEYLLSNGIGKQFVSWYYAASPPIADFIRSHEWLRAIVRTALLPVVWAVSFFMRPYGPILLILLFMGMAALSFRLYRRGVLS